MGFGMAKCNNGFILSSPLLPIIRKSHTKHEPNECFVSKRLPSFSTMIRVKDPTDISPGGKELLSSSRKSVMESQPFR
jgi:hypothetical protein